MNPLLKKYYEQKGSLKVEVTSNKNIGKITSTYTTGRFGFTENSLLESAVAVWGNVTNARSGGVYAKRLTLLFTTQDKVQQMVVIGEPTKKDIEKLFGVVI